MLAATLALMLRALVPTGWMPVAAEGGGLGLAPCQAWSPAPESPPAAHSHHGAPEQPRHRDDHGGKAEQPCAFAGLSLSWTGASPAFDLAPPPVTAPPALAVFGAPAPAPRLAAPPPPSTGPPFA